MEAGDQERLETREAPSIVRMDGVGKVYPMGRIRVHALRDVTLSIRQGDFVAVVGPSGSGKSTLLNLIGCLDLPSEGTYQLLGRNVQSLKDNELSRLRGEGIGFVFQDYSLLRRFDALRNVELPHYYVHGRANHGRALQLLSEVGLAGRAAHKPTELSGGEQQRVAVARALMNSPFLLLADEPTGNLDSKSGRELIDLLQRLNAELQLTMVMVTHDPSVSSRAHRVIHLQDGQIVDDRLQESAGLPPDAALGAG